MEVKVGYKHTEVGVIPEEWDCISMGEVGKTIIGLTYSPSDVTNYGLLVLRSSNIQNNQLKYENNVFVTMEVPKRVIVQENDILICVRNGSKNLIGKCALIDKKAVGYAFGAFMSIYRSPFSGFVFYAFQSNIIQKQIDETMGATINQITNKNLSDFKIPLPPLPEQQAIAKVLSDTDNLIQALEKQIAKKRLIKQGVMQELLRPKVDWEQKKLGNIVECYSGGTPNTSISRYYGGEIRWITSGDLNKKFISEVEGRITAEGLRNSSSKIIKRNTLLIALYGATAGIAAISSISAAINQAVLAIIPQEKYSSLFLFYKLSHLKDWIISTYTQGGQPNLSGNILKSIEIAFPSFEEQHHIATNLSDLDNEIMAIEIKLMKYKAIKQGLMQQLLTGKIRLL